MVPKQVLEGQALNAPPTARDAFDRVRLIGLIHYFISEYQTAFKIMRSKNNLCCLITHATLHSAPRV